MDKVEIEELSLRIEENFLSWSRYDLLTFLSIIGENMADLERSNMSLEQKDHINQINFQIEKIFLSKKLT